MTVPMSGSALVLGVPGFRYDDLYEPARLEELHRIFEDFLAVEAPSDHARFKAYQATQGKGVSPRERSEICCLWRPTSDALSLACSVSRRCSMHFATASEPTIPCGASEKNLRKGVFRSRHTPSKGPWTPRARRLSHERRSKPQARAP